MACVKDELLRQNRKAGATLSAMNKITQTMLYRQSLISYAEKHGVTKAAIRYNTNHQYIYHWRKRYDGTRNLWPTVHIVRTITLTSTGRRRSSSSTICAAGTPTPVLWYSGSSFGREGIPDPFQAFTVSCENEVRWL